MQEPRDLKVLCVSLSSGAHKSTQFLSCLSSHNGKPPGGCLKKKKKNKRERRCHLYSLPEKIPLFLTRKEKVIESQGTSVHTQDHFFCFSSVSKNVSSVLCQALGNVHKFHPTSSLAHSQENGTRAFLWKTVQLGVWEQ